MDEKVDVQEKKKVRWRLFGPILIVFLLLLLLVVILFNQCSSSSLEDCRLETEVMGNEIVKALNAYKSDNEKYPVSLELLVPKYLRVVETPVWGDSGWKYIGYGSETFELKVGYKTKSGSYYPVMYYDPADGWICDH